MDKRTMNFTCNVRHHQQTQQSVHLQTVILSTHFPFTFYSMSVAAARYQMQMYTPEHDGKPALNASHSHFLFVQTDKPVEEAWGADKASMAARGTPRNLVRISI